MADDSEQTALTHRCGELFFAELVKDHPGALYLECCQCGKRWCRAPDGSIAACSPDQAQQLAETAPQIEAR